MLNFVTHMKPISNNEVYIRPQGRYVLSSKARNYKQCVKPEIINQLKGQDSSDLTESAKLRVTIEISGDFMTKAGTIRRVDLSNYEKIVTDTVFQALNEAGISIDDSQIFELRMYKQICTETTINYRIEVI